MPSRARALVNARACTNELAPPISDSSGFGDARDVTRAGSPSISNFAQTASQIKTLPNRQSVTLALAHYDADARELVKMNLQRDPNRNDARETKKDERTAFYLIRFSVFCPLSNRKGI